MAMAPDPFMRGPNRYRDSSAAELGRDGDGAARSHKVDEWLASERAAARAQARVLLVGIVGAGHYQMFTRARLEHDSLCDDPAWRRRLGFEVAQRMFDGLIRLLVASVDRASGSAADGPTLSGEAASLLQSLHSKFLDAEKHCMDVRINDKKRSIILTTLLHALSVFWREASVARIISQCSRMQMSQLRLFFEDELANFSCLKYERNGDPKGDEIAFIPSKASIAYASRAGVFAQSPMIEEILYTWRSAIDPAVSQRLMIVPASLKKRDDGTLGQGIIPKHLVGEFDNIVLVVPAQDNMYNVVREQLTHVIRHAFGVHQRNILCRIMFNAQSSATVTAEAEQWKAFVKCAQKDFPSCTFYEPLVLDSTNVQSVLESLNNVAKSIRQHRSSIEETISTASPKSAQEVSSGSISEWQGLDSLVWMAFAAAVIAILCYYQRV